MNLKTRQLTLVGALTSKPYAFTARSWELKNIETIDLFDSMCSNIKVNVKGNEVLRVLPLNNNILNEEWISDKSRFSYDGLNRKRFINPMIKQNGLFIKSDWKNIFSFLEKNIKVSKYKNILVHTGNTTDCETLTALDILSLKNKNVIINPTNLNGDLQSNYTTNNEILTTTGPKVYILVGTNLRLENPTLNIKLRKLSKQKSVLIAYIGPKNEHTIDMIHLGTNLNVLKKILTGKHEFCRDIQTFLKRNNKNTKIFNEFKNSISFIYGNEFSQLLNSAHLIKSVNNFKTNQIKMDVNVLTLYSGKINALELGTYNTIATNVNEGPNIHYLLNTETMHDINPNDFVIYQGTHNEKIRTRCDIILPSLTWLEKSSIYNNCFNMAQKTHIATNAPKNSREDWKIVKMISLWINNSTKQTTNIPFNNIDDLHNRLNDLSPNIMGTLSSFKSLQTFKINLNKNFKTCINFNPINIKSFIANFYQMTSIEKNSKIMKECANTINVKKNNFFKN